MAISITTTSTNPLAGTGSFLIQKTGGVNDQGKGVSTEFSVDLAYRAKVLNISFDYIVNSGTFTAGSNSADSDLIVYLYDITNSKLIEPSSFKLLSNSNTISDTFKASFQTSFNASQYRLIFHQATTTTNNYELKVDNVSVSPTNLAFGTPISDWQSYTPTIISVTGSITNYAQVSYYRRVGDSIEVSGNLVFTGAPGTWTFPLISLPPGLSFDTNKLINVISEATLGFAKFYDATPTQTYQGLVRRTGSNQVVIESSLTQSATANSPIINGASSNAIPFAFASGDRISWSFSAPILGWSSSVQVADGYDGRVVAARYNTVLSRTITSPAPTIIYENLEFDTTNSYNTTTGEYTVPSSGQYRVTGNMQSLATATTVGHLTALIVYVDGAINTVLGGIRAETTASASKQTSGSAIIKVNAGQKITIRGYSDTSNSLQNNSSVANYFTIEKLSGSPTISAQETIGALYTGAPPTGTLNSSFNKVTFGTKVIDTHGSYSSGVYTIASPGLYDVSAQMYLSGSFAAVGLVSVASVAVNGVVKYRGPHFIVTSTGAGLETSPNVNVLSVPLNAGDTIEIRVATDGTASSFSSDVTRNYFSIAKRK